jgi:endonuclease/exonuclease/phosphatase (EEP) superfamily protein YafD
LSHKASLGPPARGARGRLPAGLRTLLTVVAVLVLAVSALAGVFRIQPVSSMPQLLIAVGATFIPILALLGLVLAVTCRRRVLSIVGVILLIATTVAQLSWYYSGSPAHLERSVQLRMLASNLRYGRADPAEFVGLASRDADVVAVVELTPEAVEQYRQAGIESSFPYSLLHPGPGAGGMGIWSRYPISPLTAPGHRGVQMPAARIKVPGLQSEPIVASVHVMSPLAGDQNTIAEWARGMAGAKAQLANFAREAGPAAVLVGGDYNSTPNMRQFRDLLTNGYRDAVEQTGSGFGPTFRADIALPPLITIDHVLTRNAAVSTVRTITIRGSDHRALLATVQLPLDGGG